MNVGGYQVVAHYRWRLQKKAFLLSNHTSRWNLESGPVNVIFGKLDFQDQVYLLHLNIQLMELVLLKRFDLKNLGI